MPDKEYYEFGMKGFDEAYFHSHNLEQEYLNFSRFVQGIFISKDGWIIDTGNYQAVNLELMERVKQRVERHPLLWKLFFMIT